MSVTLPRCFSRSCRFAPCSVYRSAHCYKGRRIQSSCYSPSSRMIHPKSPYRSPSDSSTFGNSLWSCHQIFLKVRNPTIVYSRVGLGTETNLDESKDSNVEAEYKPIYRFTSMRYLRIISRLKIAQTLFTIGITLPMGYLYATGQVTQDVAFYSVALASFALAMLYAMSFFLRRIVGFVYLHRDGDKIKIAHLTFWGRRNEVIVPVSDVIPIMDAGEKPSEILLNLKRYSTSEKLYFSLKYGQVTDRTSFREVFGDF